MGRSRTSGIISDEDGNKVVTRSTTAGESSAASAPSLKKKPNNGSPGKPKSDARPASLVRALNAISQMRQKSI